MIDGNAVPPPPPETESRTQRVSIEGTLASLSAISALIVAAASMFTAVQALDVSRTAARQKIFESQLAVCMQFSELTAQATDEGAKTSGLIEGQLDDAGWEELNTRWEAGAVLSTAIYRQYLQMTMVFPDEISDLAYVATEKRTEIANRQVDAMEAEVLTPEIRADLERLSNEEADALNEAAAACRDHVSATAGI